MTEQPANPASVAVDDDSWKTPELRKAEAELDLTMAKSRKLIAQVEEKLAQMPDIDTTAKPEDIAAIKAAAEKPNAPAEMRELKKKVDAGELTWKDVLEGKALKDPAVRAAMAGRLGEMREIYQEVEEGATLEDILEARGVSSTDNVMSSGSDAPTQQQSAAPVKPTEEDYFEQNRMLSEKPPAPADPPAPPPPPAPPAPHTQEPRRTPPPQRPPAPSPDEYFDDPLAEHETPKPPAPPRDSGPKKAPRRRSDDSDDDGDDYFGGPLLR
jgi:hypothetical protein